VLALAVTGARASQRGDAVALATDAGRKLTYGKLAVVDATGRAVPARLEVPAADRVHIVVDSGLHPALGPCRTDVPRRSARQSSGRHRSGARRGGDVPCRRAVR
jgi:hypothetical protein